MPHGADEPWRLIAEAQLAHLRADAVGADHDVGVGGCAVTEAERIAAV